MDSITREVAADLPEELQEQLKLGGGGSKGPTTADRVLSVLNDQTPLSINEVLVAIWKQDQVVAKRTTVSTAINNLRKAGLVRRLGRGRVMRGRDPELDNPPPKETDADREARADAEAAKVKAKAK